MYTQNQIARINEPGRYQVAETLFLNVAKGGSRSWIQRINENGKRREFGLGGFPQVTIQEAKEKAIQNRVKTRIGEPVKHDVPTFEYAARQAFEEIKLNWKNEATKKEWIASLENHVFPKLGSYKIKGLIGKDFSDILKPLWQECPNMADKIRKRMATVMQWACGQGYIQFNPVQTITKPKQKTAGHFKALNYDKIKKALHGIQTTQAQPMTKALAEFQILTAVRPSEARLAEWSEVDLANRLWIVPAHKMKMEREHRIPLSTRAIEILHEIASKSHEDASQYVFSYKGKPLSRSVVSRLLKAHGIESTAHGFRASFRSWCADNNVPFEVAEKALAHGSGSVVDAYQRSDMLEQRRPVMQAWADYLK